MTLYDDYFTNEDKPFAENLNDALLLSNVFDMTVNIEFPKMFSNSTWVNTTSPRKCGVALLTLKDGLPSGVSVSTADNESVLSGTGTVKLSFYPNFNAFGKFKSMTWENTGTIVVNLKTANGTTIASNISKGNIENQSSELRTLQEIVIEIVMTNATLKTFEVLMENKQQTRYGATVGITDVTGLDDRLDEIESDVTGLDDRLDTIEDTAVVELTASTYNAKIDTDFTITAKVTDILGDAVSGKSVTLYHDETIVSSQTTNSNGEATWTITPSTWGTHDFKVLDVHCQVRVGGWKQINTYLSDRVVLSSDGRNGYITVDGTFVWDTSAGVHDLATIDNNYLPKGNATTNFDPASRTYMPVYLYSNGAIKVNKAQTSSSSVTIICTLYYPLATPKY